MKSIFDGFGKNAGKNMTNTLLKSIAISIISNTKLSSLENHKEIEQ